MNTTTDEVSAMHQVITTGNESARLAAVEQIRRELESLTEEQRLEYLRWLQKSFVREQKQRLGVRV